MKFNLCFCGLLGLVISTTVFSETPNVEKSNEPKDTEILIIRHAEKADDGFSLSTEGKARAKAYANYFKNLTIDGQTLKLDYLFAAADSKNSHRPRLTIEPTSKSLGLTIDSRFKDKNFQGLANKIQSLPHGKMILIAWHHEEIPELLRALGADPNQVMPRGKWPKDVYDWLIELRYDQNGKLIETKRISEKLMPADSD